MRNRDGKESKDEREGKDDGGGRGEMDERDGKDGGEGKGDGGGGGEGGGFYPAVLEEMERRLLRRAREVEGLDEEIALLRTKLALALAQEPENSETLLKGVSVLIRAMATRTRNKAREGGEEGYVTNLMKEWRKEFLGLED